MRKTAIALLIYLVIFAMMFFFAWYDFMQEVSVIPLGLGAERTNFLVMLFSLLGILKSVFHLLLLGRNHRYSLK